MSIQDLRTAITTAGGTPTRFAQMHLYRELVTALGGTPTAYTVPNLLRQLITLKGGTPNRWDYVGLLRQLVTTMGGTPATHYPDALEAQVAALVVPSDPYFANVSLLLMMDGANNSTTFTDLSSYGHTITANGAAKIDTSASKFGTGSLLVTTPGTDWIEAPDHAAFALGAGDFTDEIWWQPLAAGNHYIMGQGSAGGFAWNGMAVESSSQRFLERDLPDTYETGGSFVHTNGVWYYMVQERSGTTMRLYRGTSGTAVMVAKTAVGSTALTDATDPYRVGMFWPSLGSNCRIAAVRRTKGVARINNDAGGPVPTAAFPRI